MRLAQRGHQVYGLDISKAQLRYARQKADEAKTTVELLQEDMCDFNLPVSPFHHLCRNPCPELPARDVYCAGCAL